MGGKGEGRVTWQARMQGSFMQQGFTFGANDDLFNSKGKLSSFIKTDASGRGSWEGC